MGTEDLETVFIAVEGVDVEYRDGLALCATVGFIVGIGEG
jgi:hypothetical protein